MRNLAIRRSVLTAATAFGILLSLPVPAGCMSNCRDEYESAVEDLSGAIR